MILETPHIPLRISLAEALKLLEALGVPLLEDPEEQCFRADTEDFSAAIYTDGEQIKAVWFNDPLGRESEEGMAQKVELYLQRYGNLGHWEMRNDNGWMRYWFNEQDHVSMVYGVQMDVIRFNRFDPVPESST